MLGLWKRARATVVACSAIAASFNFGCSSSDKPQQPRPTLQTSAPFAGTVAVYSATFDDGTGETQYFLRDPSTQGEERLWFTEDPNLVPGKSIGVWGDRQADGIHVARFEFDNSIGSARQA